MRSAIAFILLSAMLADCSSTSQKAEDVQEQAAGPQPPSSLSELSPLELRAKALRDEQEKSAKEENQALSRARKVLAQYLFDPFSAQYQRVRLGRKGAVCGQYNGKNRYGAYTGFKDFVVPKDADVVYASTSNDGLESEPSDTFAIAWLEYCASNTEARAWAAAHAPVQDYSDEPEPEPPGADDNLTI
ncbi:MAG TPA: hypothetical protein VGD66_15640 [Allosphingosinicella sp.]|jgi:hypothetical protein